MKSTAILDLMMKDHGKIVKLLLDVEKSIGMELISTMKVFDTFEWELEKHIFIEEKAIFTSYKPTNIVEGYKMVPELIQQHNDILNRLRVMRKNLMRQRPIDYNDFKELILAHKTFEEASLYPKLDQELDVSQKEEIIKKIREIIS
ncbi:MAG: hemerythrin domain-containing protein [Thermoplasmata archaeon]|nr:hemerythrin domain-containing protein [Thermoplasmata archaeon]MBE3136712.1 hemerythrin domain-containing protein [Thermoplasmata archaeon]MBE3140485.1 hemerythrin domain-containing protein [Thermoplasmata archaeon]